MLLQNIGQYLQGLFKSGSLAITAERLPSVKINLRSPRTSVFVALVLERSCFIHALFFHSPSCAEASLSAPAAENNHGGANR